MATQNFDQLNNLRGYAETWFSKMNVSDEDKKKRVDLAMDFTEIMLMLFELIMYSKISKDAAKAFLVERTKIIADNYVGKENTAYITNWSRLVTEKIVEDTYNMVEEVKESEETEEPEATKDDRKAQTSRTIEEGEVEEVSEPTEKAIHFDEYDVDIPKDEYPTSDFRGLLLGVECATSVSNYYDFYDAVERNGATKKVWISEADDKVRTTHDEAHGQERQINKLFVVGDSELMFPGDITHGADMREIYNCRCHVEYFSDDKNKGLEKPNQNDIIKSNNMYSLPDEYFPKSVGAKFRNMNIMDLETGEMYHLVEGTYLQDKKVFAGKGGPKAYDLAEYYANKYGGKPEDWMHVKGFGYVETDDGIFRAEIHWSECEGIGKVDPFIKEWLDEEG